MRRREVHAEAVWGLFSSYVGLGVYGRGTCLRSLRGERRSSVGRPDAGISRSPQEAQGRIHRGQHKSEKGPKRPQNAPPECE